VIELAPNRSRFSKRRYRRPKLIVVLSFVSTVCSTGCDIRLLKVPHLTRGLPSRVRRRRAPSDGAEVITMLRGLRHQLSLNVKHVSDSSSLPSLRVEVSFSCAQLLACGSERATTVFPLLLLRLPCLPYFQGVYFGPDSQCGVRDGCRTRACTSGRASCRRSMRRWMRFSQEAAEVYGGGEQSRDRPAVLDGAREKERHAERFLLYPTCVRWRAIEAVCTDIWKITG